MPMTERSFFGAGTKIEGNLDVDGDVRIDGQFRGKVTATATIQVGERGNVHANLHAPNIIVAGIVRGDLHARDRVELHQTARVNGVLRAQRLRIEEGAVFEGQCKMEPLGEAVVKPLPPKAEERRREPVVAVAGAAVVSKDRA